jgi:hypothetical protein
VAFGANDIRSDQKDLLPSSITFPGANRILVSFPKDPAADSDKEVLLFEGKVETSEEFSFAENVRYFVEGDKLSYSLSPAFEGEHSHHCFSRFGTDFN